MDKFLLIKVAKIQLLGQNFIILNFSEYKVHVENEVLARKTVENQRFYGLIIL